MTFLSGTSVCSLERLQIHILFQELLQRRCTIQCKKQILNNYSNSCVQNAMAKNQNLPVSKVIFLWSTYSLHQPRPQNVCSCLWNPCWYLIAATKKVKRPSPAVHSLKEDDSFSHRVIEWCLFGFVLICFEMINVTFPAWNGIWNFFNYRLKNNLNSSLFSGKAALIFFLPRGIVCLSCWWLAWTLAYGLQETYKVTYQEIYFLSPEFLDCPQVKKCQIFI